MDPLTISTLISTGGGLLGGLFGGGKSGAEKDMEKVLKNSLTAGNRLLDISNQWSSPDWMPWSKESFGQYAGGLFNQQMRQLPLAEKQTQQALSKTYGHVPQAMYAAFVKDWAGNIPKMWGSAVEFAAMKALEAKTQLMGQVPGALGSMAGMAGGAAQSLMAQDSERAATKAAAFLGIPKSIAQGYMQKYLWSQLQKLQGGAEPTLGTNALFGGGGGGSSGTQADLVRKLLGGG